MRKLSYKLTLIMTLIIGLSVLILGLFLSNLIEDIYIEALGKRLEEEANMIKAMIIKEDLNTNNQQLDMISKEMGKQLSTRITIIDKDGNVLADSEYDKEKMETHKSRPEILEAYSGEIGKEIRYSETLGIEMLYVASPIYDENNNLAGVIRLSLPLKAIEESIRNFWYILILGLTVIYVITFIITYRVAAKITKPIENITKMARRITKHEYNERVIIDRNDEIGQLGKAINLMADSLEQQMTTIFENEKKLMTVLNNMSSGVILLDNTGKIMLANPAIEQLLGVSLKEIVGKNHDEVGKQNSISELVYEVLSTGKAVYAETGVYFPTKKYFNSSVVPIMDAKGTISEVLVVLHDITKIKKLENMRTEFVASVSHELRTPITSVKGFAETLLDGSIKDRETEQQFIQIIYNESERLHRLIVDLLDLSKIELNKEILKIESTDIREILLSTIEALKPNVDKRKITIVTELDPVYAEVDEDRIRQVIINLITNAITYTPEDGKIFLRLHEIDENKLKIEVEDTGIGIPKQSLNRIFERFYRVDKDRSRESGGTGLGLAIAKHIIESHEGSIKVDSEVGVGTRFTIILPKKNKIN